MKVSTIDEALALFLRHLQSAGPLNGTYVPQESTIALLGAVNAQCAKNMNACNWFPHHKKMQKVTP